MSAAEGGPPPATLGEIVERNARERGERQAVVSAAGRLTWAEVAERSRRLAAGLRRLGVAPGERVAILARNRSEWPEMVFGTALAGGVCVPLTWRLRGAEIRALIAQSRPACLFVEADLLAGLGSAALPTPIVLACGPAAAAELPQGAIAYEKLLGEPGRPPTDLAGPDDLAVLAYTGGTTGQPKGALWSHRTLLASASFNPFSASMLAGARLLVCTPLFAGGALVYWCNSAYHGATAVIMAFAPQPVLQALTAERITLMGLVPTMLALLVEAAGGKRLAGCHLRRIYSGAAPLTVPLLARAREVFGCEFQQGYGATETCICGTRLDPEDHRTEGPPELLRRVGSAGLPMPGVEVKVVREDGNEAAPEELGEVWIRSPGNMLGYWERPELSARVLREGWYATGDLAVRDRDGYLYLRERKDDLIKTGGLHVAPGEVEEVIASHPAVAEAAVVGLPHDRWGQQVTAVVRLKPGASAGAGEIEALCAERLAGFKKPGRIAFTDEPLPRTPLGKVWRRAVRERLAHQEGSRKASG